MKQPSPEALEAARALLATFQDVGGVECIARALDAFAEQRMKQELKDVLAKVDGTVRDAVREAVRAERDAVTYYICTTHYHEDDLLNWLRARTEKPHE